MIVKIRNGALIATATNQMPNHCNACYSFGGVQPRNSDVSTRYCGVHAHWCDECKNIAWNFGCLIFNREAFHCRADQLHVVAADEDNWLSIFCVSRQKFLAIPDTRIKWIGKIRPSIRRLSFAMQAVQQ